VRAPPRYNRPARVASAFDAPRVRRAHRHQPAPVDRLAESVGSEGRRRIALTAAVPSRPRSRPGRHRPGSRTHLLFCRCECRLQCSASCTESMVPSQHLGGSRSSASSCHLGCPACRPSGLSGGGSGRGVRAHAPIACPQWQAPTVFRRRKRLCIAKQNSRLATPSASGAATTRSTEVMGRIVDAMTTSIQFSQIRALRGS
jgi:hypothetical protein